MSEIRFDTERISVEARNRKLEATWTMELAEELEDYYHEDLIECLSNEFITIIDENGNWGQKPLYKKVVFIKEEEFKV
jgi:hypothetical protein